MTALLIFLSIFLLILLFLLFVKLNIKFTIKYGFENDNTVKLRFFVIHPFFGFNIKLNKDGKKKDTKPEKSNENQNSQDEDRTFLQKAKEIKNSFDIIRNTISDSEKNIKKTVNIKEINLKINFGLSDAAITGISTGILWAALYSVFAFLTRKFTVNKHDFKIDPIFNKTIFTIAGDGIIYARLVNIIGTLTATLKTYNKLKNSNKI